MVGRFTGQNGSMKFHTGETYGFTTYCKNNWLILDVGNGLWCPYGSLEKLMENWVILEK